MRARYGRRIRRGVAGTAVAAAAMAALTGSQSAAVFPQIVNASSGAPVTPPPGDPIDGGSPDYFTALPPLNTPAPGTTTPSTGTAGGTGAVTTDGSGLPATVLEAYRRAEVALAASDPGCNMRWELLAAIGQVESNQARGGNVDADGTTISPILGPVLNGDGFANITDTDHGTWDGDSVHDRAVGPMQFIPQTWQTWGADGNGDGVSNPNNIFDAALAAGRYLCAGNRDMSVESDLHQAILGYNHSEAYLNTVLAWYAHFRKGGIVSLPDIGGAGSDTPETLPSSPSPSHFPSWSPSPSASPNASDSGSPRPTKSPRPTASSSGTIGTPTPTGGTSPTGPTSPTSPTDDPTTGGPTTGPTDTPTDPTSPTCPTDSPSPTGTATPTPTDTSSPACPTDSPSPTATDTSSPSDSATEGATASGKAA
ncbi:lytic transglycosylase domain-containing protein [Streptomyces sp. MI02-7b]|uniref:lytic transglycosylase domain-containing protein n=1 Tax=Streptomyces sp. MI02-7b TaxID=462941 RepID=UPI0029A54823|nr:lytic transglycosylase domain-containing protein [Streptomyces sp. MI02-7b]MDX3074329.1 lytic transglycosylase domain-containing protein [Streptomyces sp. MI02-7b]